MFKKVIKVLFLSTIIFHPQISAVDARSPILQADFNFVVVCVGDLVPFTDESTCTEGSIDSWLYDFGDGNQSIDQNPVHSYLFAGTYQVKLVVSSGEHKDSITKTVAVGEYPISSVSIYGNPNFCDGDSVQISVPHNSSYTYQWKVGDIPIAGAISNFYYAESTGNYSVRVTNTVGNCISDSNPVSVLVYPSPDAPAIQFNGSTDFCENDSLVLSVADNPDYTYIWELNGGSIGSYTNSYVAKVSGDYWVRVTNAEGCLASSINTVTLTVHQNPASPTLNLSGSNIFCEGDRLTLSVIDPGTDSYQWLNELGVINDETGTSLTIDETGLYKVRVRNTGLCEAFSQEINVTVYAYPISPVIVAENYTLDACQEEDPIVLRVENEEAGVFYQWYRNGVVILGGTGSSLTGYLEEGEYWIEASSNRCSVSSERLTIHYEEASLCTGIAQHSNNQLKIMQNPNPGNFILELDNHFTGEISIDIFSATGRKITNSKFQKESPHFKTQIDLSEYPTGIYFLGLSLAGEFRSGKIMVVE